MAAKGPLREFGSDPVSGKPVVARDGRFGVYVTDGETNASIGKGDRIEEMIPERAFELLAIRREQVAAKGGAPAKKSRPRSRRRRRRQPRSVADGLVRGVRGRRRVREEHPGGAPGRRRSAPC